MTFPPSLLRTWVTFGSSPVGLRFFFFLRRFSRVRSFSVPCLRVPPESVAGAVEDRKKVPWSDKETVILLEIWGDTQVNDHFGESGSPVPRVQVPGSY